MGGDHGKPNSEDALHRQAVLRKLYIASALCSSFIVVEVVGGLMAHSLAILSDAAHLLSDLTSFAVAIGASHLATLPATQQHTYGLKRSESIAALFSMITLACVCVGLGYEAINRLLNPPDHLVDGRVMSGIASIGVLVNIALAFVLGEDHAHLPGHSHGHGDHDDHDHHHEHGHHHNDGYKEIPSYQNDDHDHDHDHHHHDEDHVEEGHSHAHAHHDDDDHDHHHDNDHDHDGDHDHANYSTFASEHQDEAKPKKADKRNINLRAAYMHVLGDLAQSCAVLIAGIIIWIRPDWHVVDPILTLVFAILVFYSTFGVVRSSIAVLLEETPPHISWQEVFDAITKVPNVTKVHDLHIWSISHGVPTLSVHCHSDDPSALKAIQDVICHFGVHHSTIQIQTTQADCITCGEHGCCTGHLSSGYDE
eukprot:Nitzschia sp. Nitz4//scaffold76_size158648//23266//24531//NITZ4_002533-RA/size158648-processed-gene-0.258-mRNA-1//-1//CDS//3329557806//8345//frame0